MVAMKLKGITINGNQNFDYDLYKRKTLKKNDPLKDLRIIYFKELLKYPFSTKNNVNIPMFYDIPPNYIYPDDTNVETEIVYWINTKVQNYYSNKN